VPKIFPVTGMPHIELDTPSPEDWKAEGIKLRAAAAA
jgi:hypothetical protein